MKNVFLLLVLFVVRCSFAQDRDRTMYSGIFLNAEDYTVNKLSYQGNCDSASSKIKADHFWSQSYVSLMRNGKKIKLNRDSIFGYRNCRLGDFRFYKNDDRNYKILENKGMIIYTANVRENSSSGKTFTLVPAYFFSKTLLSEILPLTTINLKRTFPDNLKFHDLLDVEFVGAKDLSAYDVVHKMYKVNFLLSQSINL